MKVSNTGFLAAVPGKVADTRAGAVSAADTFVSSSEEVPPKIKAALEAAGRPYYDAERDQKDIAAYYENIDQASSPAELFTHLNGLVSRTHREKFSFNPEKYLFPWVDLRPNLRLQSIYSAEPVATNAPVKRTKSKDFIVKMKVPAAGRVAKDGTVGEARMVNRKIDLRSQAERWTQALMEGPLDALQIAQKIAAVEGVRYYNGEHSVAQFFFDGSKVPKGDLHHLFACERDSNCLRGCRPYGDVEKVPANRKKDGWGPKEVNRFEPDAGKGAVARATLYFLLRYPGELGDKPDEYTKKDLEILLRWHREDPPGLYERHRNQAIAEMQGNRNPFIDHPGWADKIDFTAGFGP